MEVFEDGDEVDVFFRWPEAFVVGGDDDVAFVSFLYLCVALQAVGGAEADVGAAEAEGR